MAQSQPTTVLPGNIVQIPFGKFFYTLGVILLITPVVYGFFILPEFVNEIIPRIVAFAVCWGLGGLILLRLVLVPGTMAMDVGNRIPEIKAARERDESLKKVHISHPYFGAITFLNITLFWSGIGWVIALAWSCSPGKVVIPDKLFKAAFPHVRMIEPKVLPVSVAPTPVEATSQEAEIESPKPEPLSPEIVLQAIDNLVDRGLLTKEEAKVQRTLAVH